MGTPRVMLAFIMNEKLIAVLFAAAKPLSFKALAKILGTSPGDVPAIAAELVKEKNTDTSALHVLVHEGEVQLVTNPALSETVSAVSKEEFTGELTRPQLETISIICYRGPVTKPEIEQIRGVNCSLILRNLSMRGLIEEKENSARLQSVYIVSMDFLRHLGVKQMQDLPEFERFHSEERIGKLLADSTDPSA